MANTESGSVLKAARSLVGKAGDWVDPFLKLAVLFSGLYSMLVLWVAKDDLHLLVWIEEDTTIYPAKLTDHLSLPLEFDGQTAKTVRILKTKVVNYGKQMIGKPESMWNLSLESAVSSHLTLLKEPAFTPASLVLSTTHAKPNAVTLQLGAFQPRSTIDLQLLLVNAKEGPPFTVKSSLPGLPREMSTVKPTSRLVAHVFPWMVLFVLLALAVEGVPLAVAESKQHESYWAKARVWIGRALVGLVLAAVAGFLLAQLLANVVSWFL